MQNSYLRIPDIGSRRKSIRAWLQNEFPGMAVTIRRVVRSVVRAEQDDYMDIRVDDGAGGRVAEFGVTTAAFTSVRPTSIAAILRRPLSAALLLPTHFFLGTREGRLLDQPGG